MMRRDLNGLTSGEFDLVIVGGGIFGVCTAWEAASRGLKVALLEQGDFAGATSGNCFKIAHGGIRYLQHVDISRALESCYERQALLRIAPHLVAPLPILIPTYGAGAQSKWLLRLGCFVYDALTWNRNRGIQDPQRRIPVAKAVSKTELLNQFPGLTGQAVTGGVLFHDAQIYNPVRLALAFLQSAVAEGACAANYAQVQQLVLRDDRVVGVEVRDLIDNVNLQVRAKMVINAAGPWVPDLVQTQLGVPLAPPPVFSRDVCLVAARPWNADAALAVCAQNNDPDAVLSRSRRHLFITPWRDSTLIGVWHQVHLGHPEGCNLSEAEIQQYIDEVNEAYPALNLTRNEVSQALYGVVLSAHSGAEDAQIRFGKRSRIIDHQAESGIQNLISVIGVRYTMGRAVGVRAVELAAKKLGRQLGPSNTATIPLFGGDIPDLGSLLESAINSRPNSIDVDVIETLVRDYGTAYGNVLRYADDRDDGAEFVGDSHVLKAEVIHAVREEMAQKLSDVVLRRTEMGTATIPEDKTLGSCARLMAEELGWDAVRQQSEVDDFRSKFGHQLSV